MRAAVAGFNMITRIHWFSEKLMLLVVILFCLSAFAQEKPAGIVWTENFEHGLGKEWRDINFSGKTSYSIVPEGTNNVLKSSAVKSASGLAHEVSVPANLLLSWRWKIEKVPPGASETDIAKFDHVARVFVAFKTAIGPPRTINYAWCSDARVGDTFHHPRSNRSRWIVVESGNSKAGNWVTETRDLAKDWEALFGDKNPPAISAIGLMTDSDGTGTELVSYYDDLELKRINSKP